MTVRHEKAAILIVEDEAKMRRLLELRLGEEGFVVESPSQLGPALGLLARDPALRREMGARARRRALEFTAQKFAVKAREFYEATLRAVAKRP